jgi:hypothetical protein
MTNASLYAYVADGKNGLKVLQLTDPETMPDYAGFSPRPRPVQIAFFKTKGEALAVSKGLDRDRAADESGNQVAVFGRRGARPFRFEETMRMLRTNDGTGDFFQVSDTPTRKNAKKTEGGSPEPSALTRFLELFLLFGPFGLCFGTVAVRLNRRSRGR